MADLLHRDATRADVLRIATELLRTPSEKELYAGLLSLARAEDPRLRATATALLSRGRAVARSLRFPVDRILDLLAKDPDPAVAAAAAAAQAAEPDAIAGSSPAGAGAKGARRGSFSRFFSVDVQVKGLADVALPDLGRGVRLRLVVVKSRPHAPERGPGEPIGDEVAFQTTLLSRGGGTMGTTSHDDCPALDGISWYSGSPRRGIGYQAWARTLADGRVRFWYRTVRVP